jgi:hypothetical protein
LAQHDHLRLVLALVVRECPSEGGPVLEAFRSQRHLLLVWKIRIQ